MAGQIAELARYSLPLELPPDRHRRCAHRPARCAGRGSCASFDERLAQRAAAKLERMGVEIRTRTLVTGHGRRQASSSRRADGVERLAAMTKIWSAGVQASPLGAMLAAQAGVEPTRSGQVPVEPRLHAARSPRGLRRRRPDGARSAARARRGRDPVGTARGGRDPCAASTATRSRGPSATATSAASPRSRATTRSASAGNARVWGFAGWLLWLVVHLTFLTGFKNRVGALFHWTISFFGRSRPERTITAQQIFARQALAASVRGGDSDELSSTRRGGG